MGDPATRRPIEDFFLHPTFDMALLHPSDAPSEGHFSQARLSHDGLMLKLGRKRTPKPQANITDLREPVFWHGYTSEEEVASPVDQDDMSMHSESECSDSSRSCFPEALAEDCSRVEHQCNRAQAVVFRTVGKAKVVAVGKPVDVSRQPRIVPPILDKMKRRSVPHLSRLQISSPDQQVVQVRPQVNRSNFSAPLIEDTSDWTLPAPFKRRKSVPRLPSVPLVQAAARALPAIQTAARAITPETPARSNTVTPQATPSTNFMRHGSLRLSPRPSTPTSSPSNLARRMTKFSSTMNLNRFGRNLSRSSTGSSSSEHPSLESVKEPDPVALSPRDSYRMSMAGPKPKMVARGANERAPVIVLPPCPDDDLEEVPRVAWPKRTSSAKSLQRRKTMHESNSVPVPA